VTIISHNFRAIIKRLSDLVNK
jgi:hypothetical protein